MLVIYLSTDDIISANKENDNIQSSNIGDADDDSPLRDISNNVITGISVKKKVLLYNTHRGLMSSAILRYDGPRVYVDARQRKRKRDKARYAAMSVEKKQELAKKRRESRKKQKSVDQGCGEGIHDMLGDHSCFISSVTLLIAYDYDYDLSTTYDIIFADKENDHIQSSNIDDDGGDDSSWMHKNYSLFEDIILASENNYTHMLGN